jgi:hypothetical protein
MSVQLFEVFSSVETVKRKQVWGLRDTNVFKNEVGAQRDSEHIRGSGFFRGTP